jgi:cytochrome c oxidase assembly protein subunit 15
MDFTHGFTLLRELGHDGRGGYLTHDALVAIHMAHRLFALVVSGVLLVLAWKLWRTPALQRFGLGLALLLGAQIASGLSNVVLGWPLAAALGHSAGAAALVLLLTLLIARTASRALLAADAAPRVAQHGPDPRVTA